MLFQNEKNEKEARRRRNEKEKGKNFLVESIIFILQFLFCTLMGPENEEWV